MKRRAPKPKREDNDGPDTTLMWRMMGGLFISQWNAGVKNVGSALWNSMSANLSTTPPVYEELKIEEPGGMALELAAIEREYSKFSIYEEEGWHLYVKSRTGLFCVHLPSGKLMQGYPWLAPYITPSVKQALERDAGPDKDERVKRFQLNALLNMLLKDVTRIVDGRGSGDIPEGIRALMKAIDDWSTEALEEKHFAAAVCPSQDTNMVPKRMGDIKKFLFSGIDTKIKRSAGNERGLYYMPEPVKLDAAVKLAQRMGFLFQCVLLHKFVVIVEPIETEDMVFAAGQPSSLPTGQCKWMCMGRLRYTIQD